MKVSWIVLEGRPYVEVLSLEAVLRDMAEEAEENGDDDEAEGILRVAAILESIVRKEKTKVV